MAKEHPIIMYVGDKSSYENLTQEVQPHQWLIFHADTMRGALAQYLFFRPDITVIEENDFTAEVVMHLCSVDAYPIVILTDNNQPWLDQPVYSVPRHTSASDLTHEITKLLEIDIQPVS